MLLCLYTHIQVGTKKTPNHNNRKPNWWDNSSLRWLGERMVQEWVCYLEGQWSTWVIQIFVTLGVSAYACHWITVEENCPELQMMCQESHECTSVNQLIVVCRRAITLSVRYVDVVPVWLRVSSVLVVEIPYSVKQCVSKPIKLILLIIVGNLMFICPGVNTILGSSWAC